VRKINVTATDNPNQDPHGPDGGAPSMRVERFIVARAEETEFAVPASAVAAIDIATEERWADLGADVRGVLWEGRYLVVSTIPGGGRIDVAGRGEFPFLVLRGREGLSALVIDRLLGEVLAVREPAAGPWAACVRSEGRQYPVLPMSPEPPGAVTGPAAAPEPAAEREPPAAAAAPGAPEPKRGKRGAARERAPEPPPAPARKRGASAEPELLPAREPEADAAPRPEAPEAPSPVVPPAAAKAEPSAEPAPHGPAEPAPPAETAAAAATTPAEAEISAANGPRRRRRAVVVDPRAGWRRALARRLRERGLEVREAVRAGEFRGPAGIAFIGDLQAGVSPEAVAETLRAAGWRAVLVTSRPPATPGPFETAIVWPVRDEDLDSVLARMGGTEDAGGEGRSNPGGGTGST